MTRSEAIDAATEERNARHLAAQEKYATELAGLRQKLAVECEEELASADADWQAAIEQAKGLPE